MFKANVKQYRTVLYDINLQMFLPLMQWATIKTAFSWNVCTFHTIAIYSFFITPMLERYLLVERIAISLDIVESSCNLYTNNCKYLQYIYLLTKCTRFQIKSIISDAPNFSYFNKFYNSSNLRITEITDTPLLWHGHVIYCIYENRWPKRILLWNLEKELWK